MTNNILRGKITNSDIKSKNMYGVPEGFNAKEACVELDSCGENQHVACYYDADAVNVKHDEEITAFLCRKHSNRNTAVLIPEKYHALADEQQNILEYIKYEAFRFCEISKNNPGMLKIIKIQRGASPLALA